MRTHYSTTQPRWSDTPAISRGKLLQVANEGCMNEPDCPDTGADFDFTADDGSSYSDLLDRMTISAYRGLDHITSITINKLTASVETIDFEGCNDLISLGAPLLTSIRAIYLLNNALMTTVSIPNLSSITVEFLATGCALSAATVDHILRRMVVCGVGAGQTIDLSGGTSSGIAGLSVQGAADYATLQGNGATVNLNP